MKIGTKVIAPITNQDGQPDHRVGILKKINSRFAHVEIDGVIIKVGKSKIEVAESDENYTPDGQVRMKGYLYEKTRAPSGRLSCDNADDVAQDLRGMPLDDARKLIAAALDVTVRSLVLRYNHLDNGRERMCLGNLLRGARKRVA